MNLKLIAATLAATALFCGIAHGSSHREAPFITKYPQVDSTDFYLFRSYEPGREDYVTLIANYVPVQAAYGGPNYFPLDSEALYEIHVDNDGDAREDISFQFRFNDVLPGGDPVQLTVGGTTISSVLRNVDEIDADAAPGLSHTEEYSIEVALDGQRRRADSAINLATGDTLFAKPFDYSGTKTFGGPGGYSEYAASFIHDFEMPNCAAPGRVFVGQRNEAFKINLGEVFDLVNFVPVEGDSAPGAGDGGGFLGGVTQDPERNVLARNNVTSIALEVHKDCLTDGDDPVIGAWTSASLRQLTIQNPRQTFKRPEVGLGAFVQVSRLSAPLVNELFIGYDKKDRFNGSQPKNDGQFIDFVTNPGLPLILDILFREAVNETLATEHEDLAPSNFPRNDLVTAFLTGFPGLNQPANVVPSEMMRLNTEVDITPRAQQSAFGVAGGDVAGFPNGRRPGDDVVDIALRVAMGALCYPVPIGEGGTPFDLGLCTPEDAPVGDVAFTDGAPLSAADLENAFPYLLTPYPGSPFDAPLPKPAD